MCKIQKLFKYSNMNVRRNISTACLEKRVSIQSKCAMRSVKMSNTQRNEVFDLIWKMQYQTNTTTTVHLHESATKVKFPEILITICDVVFISTNEPHASIQMQPLFWWSKFKTKPTCKITQSILCLIQIKYVGQYNISEA